MDHFEFNKVASVMKHLKWKWYPSPHSPEEWEIREYLRQMLDDIPETSNKKGTYVVATGGFVVTAEWGDSKQLEFLEARFELTQWSA